MGGKAPERIVYLMKARIKHSFGLTCSVGIGPNKLLAKLASDMKKPDGLTIIRPDEVSQVIDPLPIKELCGIGSRMERRLNLLGIITIGDLGRFPVDILKRKFGINGQHLHDMGLGIDHSPVVPESDQDKVKSVGHSMTLKRDASRRQDILKYLLQLSEMVGRRARRYGVSGKTVSLYVRYADFYSSIGKQQTLANPINQSDDIYKKAIDILDTIELQQPVRLLGIRLTNLKYQVAQLPLFPQERRKALMVSTMDAVNNLYGDFTMTFASLMDTEEKGSHVISPAWRPDGIRCVDVE
jgi:DNA polymerase IV